MTSAYCIIYARSYEDTGNIVEAKKHLEVLLTWDPSYRDVFGRLARLQRHERGRYGQPHDTDYTGLTVSLLGPDTPRANEVAPELINIVKAREKELHVAPGERSNLDKALNWHFDHGANQFTASKALSYDVWAYIKYDHLLPEDEIKKELELVNLLSMIEDRDTLRRSLDIGAATGRHPTTLIALGIPMAIGIDVEFDAMKYACQKRNGRLPAYVVGRGEQLPFQEGAFDLITCMMGTFAHLTRSEQESLAHEARRCLVPGGRLYVSTWDVECRHLSFLSMYTYEEKEAIRTNSLAKREVKSFFEGNGFSIKAIRSFGMLPDVFNFELRYQAMEREDLQRIVEMDLAARGTFPNMHGQMYIVYVEKPI